MKIVEFAIGDRRVRSHLMKAEEQWNFACRVEPMLPAIDRANRGDNGHRVTIQDLLAAFSSLEKIADRDTSTMLAMTFAATEMWVPPSDTSPVGAWSPVVPSMFDLAEVLQIMAHVVAHNLGPLYAMERPKFTRTPSAGTFFEPAHMPDEADWLYRPVLRGMIKLESIWDGSVHIEQIAKANDIIDVAEENERRAMRAAEKKRI